MEMEMETGGCGTPEVAMLVQTMLG